MCESSSEGDYSHIDLNEFPVSFDCVEMRVLGPNDVSECCGSTSVADCIPAKKCPRFNCLCTILVWPSSCKRQNLVNASCWGDVEDPALGSDVINIYEGKASN